MAKSQSGALKKDILSRFPTSFIIKRERVTQTNRTFTRASVLTASGLLVAEREGPDFEGALKNLAFRTSFECPIPDRLGADSWLPSYKEQAAASDKSKNWTPR